jgi:hypothetical protein
MFKRFVDRIIDMDINVIFTATAMHKEDEEGEDLVLPDLQGKDYAISQYVCAQMCSVYYLGMERPKSKRKQERQPRRVLLSNRYPPYFAKDRYDALPLWTYEPDMSEIIKAIEESAEFGAAEKDSPMLGPRDDDDDIDDDLDDDGEEEPEDNPKPPAVKAQRPGRSRVSRPRKGQEEAPEDDSDDDEPEPPKRQSKTATRKPATRAKPVRSSRAKKDFDPDDDIDLDDDDEEL